MRNRQQFRWNDNLTGAALNIAQSNHTPIRVLAGPGTGKTFALMRRVARLLQTGTPPESILVCTFTRTSARDLQSEISRLGLSGVGNIESGTIHSFCFKMLAQEDVFSITQRVTRPLLNFEERFLVEDLNGDGFGGVREKEKRIKAFNAAWARLQSDNPGWPPDNIDRNFQSELRSWLEFHRAILIGELVPLAFHYIRDNPTTPFRNSFGHVLVDEYQDLNRAEQILLDLLSESGSLIVIGDEDQSIYSFKHAHPEGISTFNQNHINTHDENLMECRRCPRNVVNMANSFIQYNVSRTPRNLRPFPNNPEGEVLILQWRNMEEEAQGIASLIEQRIRNGQVEPGRILVLAPRRQFGYAVRDALNNIEINALSFFHEEAFDGNPKLIENSNAQQAFTLLNLLADNDDRVSLRCWCGFGSNSLLSGAWRRLREYCSSNHLTPRSCLEQLTNREISIPNTNRLVERYIELQNRLHELEELIGFELIDALFPEGDDWSHPFRLIAEGMEENEISAQNLKNNIRIGVTQPELPTDVNYVRIMSLHKSKGLTADMVVVLGCIDGLIPQQYDQNTSDLTEEQHDQEQRRLFYVAITRTRNILVLSSVRQLPRDLAHRMRAIVPWGNQPHARTIASSFLNELGPARPTTVLGSTVIDS